jgi:hypothetical protein
MAMRKRKTFPPVTMHSRHGCRDLLCGSGRCQRSDERRWLTDGAVARYAADGRYAAISAPTFGRVAARQQAAGQGDDRRLLSGPPENA